MVFTVLGVFCLALTGSGVLGAQLICGSVATSEGVRTLLHGQRACAPLTVDETETDKGLRFITCNYGTVFTQSCHSVLRYDVSSGTCNWPSVSSCKLPDADPKHDASSQSPTTAAAPTTSRPYNPSPTSSRQPQQSDSKTPAGASSSPPSYTPAQTSTTRRPTPPAPTGPCNSGTCKLPNCFCYGARPNMSLSDTPMFLMLTFDDGVTAQLYNNFFQPLFVANSYSLYNPNGCGIRTALYVSLDNTDYSKVKVMYDAGNEIASHTVHHILPQGDKDSDYKEMVDEIEGMKRQVLKETGDKALVDSIIGFRAPYLRVAGDVQFDVLRDYGFLYDTSVTNIEASTGRPPLYPFTFDYLIGRCVNPPCPTKSYPGIWEVPLNSWVGDNGYACSMVDACSVGTSYFSDSETQWYNLYKKNFEKYFYPVKVPMPYFTHGSMFLRSSASYTALVSWLQDLLLTHDDVWVVTPKQVLDWMRNPLTNAQMKAQRWGC
ncbi:unnamed protein product [Lymnaea stagnalis]|uniref:NodB homology domain-containing protein n=1 Tax=Lymnaea stagnalis TaxID=6523 RepID=A0AAV2HU32_LYMST